MLRFDDKHATKRRLDCATLLRDVLENKVKKEGAGNVIDQRYDMGFMVLASQALGDLAAKAATLHENNTLRSRFLEPSMDW